MILLLASSLMIPPAGIRLYEKALIAWFIIRRGLWLMSCIFDGRQWWRSRRSSDFHQIQTKITDSIGLWTVRILYEMFSDYLHPYMSWSWCPSRARKMPWNLSTFADSSRDHHSSTVMIDKLQIACLLAKLAGMRWSFSVWWSSLHRDHVEMVFLCQFYKHDQIVNLTVRVKQYLSKEDQVSDLIIWVIPSSPKKWISLSKPLHVSYLPLVGIRPKISRAFLLFKRSSRPTSSHPQSQLISIPIS
jgi:hypothetical protein